MIYQKIYKTKREEKNRFVYFYKTEVPLLVYQYKRYLLYAFVLFFACVGIGIISANAQGLAGIEKVMFQTNENIEIVGITLLEMVKEIEKCENVKKISEKFDFLTLIKYFNAMKVDAIVVGCTHFPYVKEEFKKLTNIEILDPGIKMIEKI